MSRVRYLAALGGTAGRRAPAPLLRPPRRLFPHEPPPLELLPPSSQPADEVLPASEQPLVRPEPRALEPLEQEPVETVRPSPARKSEARLAPSPAELPVEEVLRPSGEDAPPLLEAVPVLETPSPSPPKGRAATDVVDSARPARRDGGRKPASLELEPARAEPPRRSPAALEPPRLLPPAPAPSEQPVAAARSAASATQAPGLHIGSIDVVVSPPPQAAREPALAAAPEPAHRPPAPFAARGASTSRCFGLAQR